VPRRFARLLVDHEVSTVQEAGWSSLSNGALIRAAASAGYEALVTVDQSIPFQQNLQTARLGIVILAARSNRFEDLQPLLSATLAALATLQAGDIVRVAV
jgi:hypothetical protein